MTVAQAVIRRALGDARQLVSILNGVVPVELSKLADRLGVERIEGRPLSAEGYLGRTADGQLVIRYRQGRPRVRTRFTIAHELGHILLARAQGNDVTTDAFRNHGGSKVEESIVNRIAAEILMPTDLILPLLRGTAPNWRRLEAIRALFDVSMQALIWRILDLPQLTSVWIRMGGPNKTGADQRTIIRFNCSRGSQITFDCPPDEIANRLVECSAKLRAVRFEVFARDEKAILVGQGRNLTVDGWPEYWFIAWDEPAMAGSPRVADTEIG